MPRNRTVSPHTGLFSIQPIIPTPYVHQHPIPGHTPPADVEYIRVPIPEPIPTYSFGNMFQWYQTTENPTYLVPLFMEIPEKPLSEFDTYFEITTVEKDRFDILSKRFYDTVEFWYILYAANDVADPFDIPPGTIIRVPSLSHVFRTWLQGTDV